MTFSLKAVETLKLNSDNFFHADLILYSFGNLYQVPSTPYANNTRFLLLYFDGGILHSVFTGFWMCYYKVFRTHFM